MRKIKIIDLLCLISNGEEVPKYVKYRNYLTGSFDTMMVCKENLIYKLDQLEIQLNSRVEILDDKEDKDIPLIPDDELNEFNMKDRKLDLDKLNYNFLVLKDQINILTREFNECRKEDK